MVIIYSQDSTYIKADPDIAKDTLISLYGEKLGMEAYTVIKDARVGTTYRKNGGPLVQVISKDEATWIRNKEIDIGMLKT